MQDLFRKEAIDSFSSNRGLTAGVRASGIKMAVISVLLFACAAIFALWLVFGTVYETITVSGVIRPQESEGVYSETGGIISKTAVKEGDSVDIGDIIAVIPHNDILAEIESASSAGAPQEDIERLYDKYDSLSIIKSPIAGIVTEMESENTYISPGGKIATVTPYSKTGNNKILTAFVPSGSGGNIDLGMEVQVMPDFASREKYGYINAYISGISSYPVAGRSIKENSGELFVTSMNEDESYLRLEITLVPDAQSKSGLKWSNPDSGDIDAVLGTVCDADIVIEKCSPIEWLF